MRSDGTMERIANVGVAPEDRPRDRLLVKVRITLITIKFVSSKTRTGFYWSYGEEEMGYIIPFFAQLEQYFKLIKIKYAMFV